MDIRNGIVGVRVPLATIETFLSGGAWNLVGVHCCTAVRV